MKIQVLKNRKFLAFFLIFSPLYLFSNGSLVIDKKQGNYWGVSWNYPTIKEADDRALSECKKYGTHNCSIVLRTRNNCASYYVDTQKGSTVYGWGKADNITKARIRALSECRKRGGNSCVERVWGCDSLLGDEEVSNAKEYKKSAQKKTQMQQSKNKKTTISAGVKASLLMLIDISGSMSGQKLSSAKSAAKKAVKTALGEHTEVAILAFEGDCSNPINKQIGFIRDKKSLYRFIDSLQAQGGTPLGNALRKANHFMNKSKSKSSKTQMILLLADGDDGCKNVDSVMAELRRKGIIFRHETVGLGINSNSNAARDLKTIANRSGGTYHQTHDPKRLNSIFLEAIETMQMLDMLGQFGNSQKTSKKSNRKGSQSGVSNMQSIFDTFE